MKRAVEVTVLVLAFGALVVLATARYASQGNSESFYSSYDVAANGYMALYNVLDDRGVAVERYERPLQFLPPRGTLVLTTNRPERQSPSVLARGWNTDDTARLREYARRGGRVVLLDDDGLFAFPAATGIADDVRFVSGTAATPVVRSAETRGVTRVEAPHVYLQRYRSLVAGYPLLGTSGGAVAYRVPVGLGDIIVVTSAKIFDNAHIARADNMLFAADILARRGPVYFDEYVHGYSTDASFWAALPRPVHTAVWIVAALAGAMLIDANVRTAPAIPLDPPDERDSSAYVVSMARLLRRARAGRAAVRRFAADAARIVRNRERPDLARAANELHQLAGIAHPSGADVVRAAHLHALIRKDRS